MGFVNVLVTLIHDYYERFLQVDMKSLTCKVLFLVALASNHCISEPHALSLEPPFLIERSQSFTLDVNLAFLLKASMDAALPGHIELQAFHPDPSYQLERRFQQMCPARALKICLQQTVK